jgi:hypothetical protein
MQKQSKLKYDDVVFLKKVRQKEKPIKEFQNNALHHFLGKKALYSHHFYIKINFKGCSCNESSKMCPPRCVKKK